MWNFKENSITQQGIQKIIKSRVLKPLCRGNVKVTKKALKTVTSQIYEKINNPFKKNIRFNICEGTNQYT